VVAGIIQNYEIKPRVLVYSRSKLTGVLLCKASSNVALETIQAYSVKPCAVASIVLENFDKQHDVLTNEQRT